MLARRYRITGSDDFARIVRRGQRRAGRLIVIHSSMRELGLPSRFGFVVSKAVGNSVVRNSVKRKLRALAAERIATGDGGMDAVIRALPSAANANWHDLRAEFCTLISDRPSGVN